MLTLCIDTAYKYLSTAIILDNEVIVSESIECFKRQSEEVFLSLERIFSKANIKKTDIDSICISNGPGSYTGVRIALTIAKVFCEIQNIDLYTISTLRLYAQNNENTMVILNARANRAYVGAYDKEKVVINDCVMELDKIDYKGFNLIGDLSLFDLEDVNPDIVNGFIKTKNSWQKVENIAYLVPEYLKESETYFQ